MPLDKSTLKSDLQDLFTKPPFAEADVAKAWGDAMNDYATPVGPPVPPPAVSAAAAALATALAGFSVANQAASIMETAFTAFGAAVASGMAPTYTGTPPAGQVGFATVFATPSADPSGRAQQLADAIDTWMKTGSAVQSTSGTPFPPTGNWV